MGDKGECTVQGARCKVQGARCEGLGGALFGYALYVYARPFLRRAPYAQVTHAVHITVYVHKPCPGTALGRSFNPPAHRTNRRTPSHSPESASAPSVFALAMQVCIRSTLVPGYSGSLFCSAIDVVEEAVEDVVDDRENNCCAVLATAVTECRVQASGRVNKEYIHTTTMAETLFEGREYAQ